jgi:class 3 adenylate cyclase
MFPIRDGAASARAACEAAMAAARDAEVKLAAFNRERAGAEVDTISFGLGLHVGDVVYGNIGVPDRLQFTVVGAAANEVSRLEDLTKPLDRRILATAEFADNLPIAWESLGVHELKGVGQHREVFAAPPA